MAHFLLLAAVIIVSCLFLRRISGKVGIPMLLVFIVLGMIFGTDGIFQITFHDYGMAEQVCSFALIFIMFYGGFGTNWKSAKPVAVQSVLLSTLGVIFTALLTGLFCFLVLRVPFWESMLIGSVISSTDAASCFSILRSKHLNLGRNTAPLLEVESGSNDPFSYMLTITVISIMKGNLNAGEFIYMLFAQLLFGIGIGVGVAYIASLIIKRIDFTKDGMDTLFILAVMLFSYSLSQTIGGNGYLSVYITGIILGNLPFRNKIAVVHFFDGVTDLMEIAIFFLLGLLAFPSKLLTVALPALLIALFITFVGRPIVVFGLLKPFKFPLNQIALISWSGLRGAASIVFAIMATVSTVSVESDIFHTVFFIVLFSILIQGTLIPFAAKKLNMIDDSCNIMKSFNDYAEESPVQFVKIRITPEHRWAGKHVRELNVIPDLLLALIIRDGHRIIPKGNVLIHEGDILVLSALSLDDSITGTLVETTIESGDEWIGYQLKDLNLEDEKAVIVAIKRGGHVVIPNGRTHIFKDDVLIISRL